MGVPSFSVTDHKIAFDFFPNLPLAQNASSPLAYCFQPVCL